MKALISLLKFPFIPVSTDFGILLLRLYAAGSMFWLHGLPKIMEFSDKAAKFYAMPGTSSEVSLVMAIIGEVVGSVLLALGLFGRFGAFLGICTMVVAGLIAHPGNELALLFLAIYVGLFFTGPGRFSFDAHLK